MRIKAVGGANVHDTGQVIPLLNTVSAIMHDNASQTTSAPGLRRSLSLPLVVLYGLGVTIGAGIYVLIGEVGGMAGVHAPMAFLIAGIVMLFPAASFAELCGRFPVAAGEARYAEAGFRSGTLSLAVGLSVALVGIVSSAAISIGSAGYIGELIDLPAWILIVAIVVLMAALAAWGIQESVTLAAVLTLIEIAGLMTIVFYGWGSAGAEIANLSSMAPEIGDMAAWAGIAAASLLAFFAFIGFEDIVNIAEETRHPARTIPKAIFITLVLSLALYIAVVFVAVQHVSAADLSRSRAPLSLVFERITAMSPLAITSIAILATLNGVIVQIIMASRVLYGLSRRGRLPAWIGEVNARSHTPLNATLLVAAVILLLALAFPIAVLAAWTSRITLAIFIIVCAALVLIKWRGDPAPEGTFIVPVAVPVTGIVLSAALLAIGFFRI